MTAGEIQTLVQGVLDGDRALLAQAISLVENREEGFRDLLKGIYPKSGDARIIGVTGSPGSGKSTLVNGLVATYGESDGRIGVIGVDPSSPFTGGSILGDRVRFESPDTGAVFFRSMSARGIEGGLAAATGDAIRLLDAAGYDPIIVETVGAGQNEVDIVRTADTVLVVVMPSSGDDVQMLKAGILEIGDLFVVNKSDLEGADRTTMDLEQMIRRNRGGSGDDEGEWVPRVIKTVATAQENVGAVRDAIEDHYDFLRASDRLRQKRLDRCADEITRLLDDEISKRVHRELEENGGLESLAKQVQSGESSPYGLTESLLRNMGMMDPE